MLPGAILEQRFLSNEDLQAMSFVYTTRSLYYVVHENVDFEMI